MPTHLKNSIRTGRRLPRENGANPIPAARQEHQSVMTREVVAMLAPRSGDTVLDATAGAGGHSEALLSAANIRLIAFDADAAAVRAVRERLARFGENATVIETNFSETEISLASLGVEHIDKVVFDLGWNRGQLYAERGFSFMADEPLNMSYGVVPASGFTAKEILNTWSEAALADVFFGYGEERYARRIAKAIVEVRRTRAIETTRELTDIIARAVPAAYRHGRLHFATKTFQALRIAVNDELRALERGLRGAWNILSGNGRIAVISFHSTEDRVVKRLFREFAEEGRGQLLVKKPLTATAEELAGNPSARSAKLRGIEKVLTI